MSYSLTPTKVVSVYSSVCLDLIHMVVFTHIQFWYSEVMQSQSVFVSVLHECYQQSDPFFVSIPFHNLEVSLTC